MYKIIQSGCEIFWEPQDRNLGFKIVISIHAPARGATYHKNFRGETIVNFNPRTREGCDLQGQVRCLRLLRFQSTHPRGVRLMVIM